MTKWIWVILTAGLLVFGGLWWRERGQMRQLRGAMMELRAERDSLLDAKVSVKKDDAREASGRPAAPWTEPISDGSVSVSAPGEPEPLMVHTAAVGSATSPPPFTEELASAIERFDMAMDREFSRLEQREQASSDPGEVTTIQRIKDRLAELDDLYRRADTATELDERAQIRGEMQAVMGSIIGLSRVDRNERLSRLATDIGYDDPAAVETFLREIDRIYHETHMDWTKLFNRAPPAD